MTDLAFGFFCQPFCIGILDFRIRTSNTKSEVGRSNSEVGSTNYYPAKPGYSHCAEPGRSDLHFSTAGRVKQTLTPPSDKTESGIRLYSARALW